MPHSIVRFLEPEACEALLRETNAFIDRAYTADDVRARRSYVYEYGLEMEAFAFAIHCPGGPETDHLPGFRLDALPDGLAAATRRACETLGLERGRVLLNVGRYAEHCEPVPEHYDGELFDFTVTVGEGNTVHSGIRPSEVALLTLRNDTQECGTTLHDADEKVIRTCARAGELLVFDNLVHQHGVPDAGAFGSPPSPDAPPRWIRYTIGWRALEEGHRWADGEPLVPIDFAEAITLHERFLAEDWPGQVDEVVARGHFPYPTRHV